MPFKQCTETVSDKGPSSARAPVVLRQAVMTKQQNYYRQICQATKLLSWQWQCHNGCSNFLL